MGFLCAGAVIGFGSWTDAWYCESLVPVSGLNNLDWEVFVIKDDSIQNAFVIPG